jgi:hypothetical protein
VLVFDSERVRNNKGKHHVLFNACLRTQKKFDLVSGLRQRYLGTGTLLGCTQKQGKLNVAQMCQARLPAQQYAVERMLERHRVCCSDCAHLIELFFSLIQFSKL